jgi:hypothetical protein
VYPGRVPVYLPAKYDRYAVVRGGVRFGLNNTRRLPTAARAAAHLGRYVVETPACIGKLLEESTECKGQGQAVLASFLFNEGQGLGTLHVAHTPVLLYCTVTLTRAHLGRVDP